MHSEARKCGFCSYLIRNLAFSRQIPGFSRVNPVVIENDRMTSGFGAA